MRQYIRPIAIIALVFSIKLVSVWYLVSLSKCNGADSFLGIASMAGDAQSYIVPIDNFMNEGSYYYDDAKAGRMPYLGSIYMVFRFFTSREAALSALVVFQVLIGSIAVYCMAKLCKKLSQKNQAFWIFIALSVVSFHVTIFDFAILTESLGTAFVGIFLYLHYKYVTQGRTRRQLLKSGLFLGFSILFKPYLSLIFVIVGMEFLWHHRKNSILTNMKNSAICSLLFFGPFFVMNLPWTVRNYLVFDRFVPFQQDVNAGYDYSKATLAVYGFIQSIGESYVSWDKRSAGCFFEPVDGLPCEYEIPERILGNSLTMEKILEAKSTYGLYLNNPSDSLEEIVVSQFGALRESYETDHPFASKMVAPLILTKHFLVHSGSYFMPVSQQSPCFRTYQLAIKAAQSLLYYAALLIGFMGLFLLLRKNGATFLLTAIPLYLILFFPIYMARTEIRYFHLAYPILLVGLTYVIVLYLTGRKPLLDK